MADDYKRNFLARIFDKLQLNYPPPRSAPRSFPRFTLGGGGVAAPTVNSRPAPARPTHDPKREKLESQSELRREALRLDEKGAREGQRREYEQHRQWMTKIMEAKYSGRFAKLETALNEKISHIERRGILAAVFEKATGQDAAIRHDVAELNMDIEDLQARVDSEYTELENSQMSGLREMDLIYQDKWTTLETAIAQAFETGYFNDEWAAAQERNQSHADYRGLDDGGRDRDN